MSFLIYEVLHGEERTESHFDGLQMAGIVIQKAFWRLRYSRDVQLPTKLEGDRIYLELDKQIGKDNNSGVILLSQAIVD